MSFSQLTAVPYYKQFTLGRFISYVGNQLTFVILPVLIIPSRGVQIFSLIIAVEMLIFSLFTLFGGIFTDRYPRNLVMAVADILSILGVAMYFIFAKHGPDWILFAATIFAGTGVALYGPAHRAAISQLVPEKLTEAAFSIETISRQSASVLGSLLAGILLLTTSAYTAMGLDIISYIISLLTLINLRMQHPRASTEQNTETPSSMFTELREGFAVVRQKAWVSVVMLQGTLMVFFFYGPNLVLVPLIAQERFNTETYGLITAFMALGSICGALVGAKITMQKVGVWAMNFIALSVLTPIQLAFHTPLWFFILGVFLDAMAIAIFLTLWFPALRRAFPLEVQGRVYALDNLANFGLTPLAIAITPQIAKFLGLKNFAFIAIIVLLLSAYLVLLVPGVSTFGDNTSSEKADTPDQLTEKNC